jgi:hypothetical protein
MFALNFFFSRGNNIQQFTILIASKASINFFHISAGKLPLKIWFRLRPFHVLANNLRSLKVYPKSLTFTYYWTKQKISINNISTRKDHDCLYEREKLLRVQVKSFT